MYMFAIHHQQFIRFDVQYGLITSAGVMVHVILHRNIIIPPNIINFFKTP